MKKYLITGLITAILAIGGIYYLSTSSECTVSDEHPETPFEKTYHDFTKEAACTKAMALCSYYSSLKETCKVVK